MSAAGQLALRPYQSAAIAAIRERYAEGDRGTLLVLPTGTGKTVVFAEVARRVVAGGGRVLILAHRAELLEQAANKLDAVGVRAGIEQAGRRGGSADVVVASVQTLRRSRLECWPTDSFSLIVVDEAHHAPATTYRTVLDYFAAARVLGVTATPDRLDGAALGGIFDSVAYSYELRDAIRDGWLARIEARKVRLEVNLDEVHTRAGDLDLRELEERYGTGAAVKAVVDPLRELAPDKRTILFAISVAHASLLADAINEHEPGAARMVSGDTPYDERVEIVADFRSGRLRVLVNCQIATEGFDVPEIECVGIARPTKSRGLYCQMLGRGTRLAPGKESVLVLDFVGLTTRHRLVTPADILAGKATPPDALAAARERDGDVLDALEDEVGQAKERAKREPWHVTRWRAELVDVFGDLPQIEPWHEPATQAQRAAIERAGIAAPPELTKKAASALIEGIVGRHRNGLCTYKQLKFLRKRGVTNAAGLTFEEANERIGRVMSRWRGQSEKGPDRWRGKGDRA